MDGEALKYQSVVELKNKNNSHTQLVLMTGRDKKVLEVGPALGYITKVLQERGCRVTGLEIDPVAAKVAEQFSEHMIVGDIEDLDFRSTFKQERFDVVMYGDVLEHLVHPERILEETAAILRPKGCVVASIPNVAHGSIRLALLAGDFSYTELGLLDKTHLRFYTRHTIRELFQDAGFAIKSWKQVILDPFRTELELREEDFPSLLVEEIRGDKHSLAYQYIVKAVASPKRRRGGSTKRSDGQLVHGLREHIASIEEQNSEKAQEIARRDAVIASRDSELIQRERLIAEIGASMAEKDALIEEKSAAILEKDAAISDKERLLHEASARYDEITGTIGFRFLQRMRRWVNRLAPAGTRRRAFVNLCGHGVDVLMKEGPFRFLGRLLRIWRWLPRIFRRARGTSTGSVEAPVAFSLDDQYQAWLERNTMTPERIAALGEEARELDYRPTISIVMPVHETEPAWLAAAIDSVLGQIYDNWELCVADDRSRRRATRKVLRRYAKSDPRIKVTFLKANQGIAGASNAALELATGEFVAYLDHDDELKPESLFEVAKLLNERRDLDFIYSDEDKRDADGRLVEPFFKPEWSPDLLMSENYVNHLSVYRKEVVDHVGGLRPDYDGSQDYDLVLRVTEVTDKIGHISRPLYTWRKAPGSAGTAEYAKQYAYEAAQRALEDAIRRRGYEGTVLPARVPGRHRVRYAVRGEPKVAIIIPTRDRMGMLSWCVDSIRQLSTYRNFEIVIVDNRSEDPETMVYLESFPGRVIPYPEEFNYARIMNTAAREVEADFYLFLNNDTEVISGEWIEALMEHAQRPEVAAVGGRLLYPDGRAQHEGIIIGFGGGSAGNVNFSDLYWFGDLVRNCSAVTGACMMVRPDVYWELGGLEERLGVAFNDVDFCLRAREKGYEVVYTPYALLFHQESATRGRLHPQRDEEFFRARWGNPGDYKDPYYNENFHPRRPFVLRVD